MSDGLLVIGSSQAGVALATSLHSAPTLEAVEAIVRRSPLV